MRFERRAMVRIFLARTLERERYPDLKGIRYG